MGFSEEFNLLLRACYPILYVPTEEEERVEQSITACANGLGNRIVYLWDFVDGYQGNPNDRGFAQRNPLQALELLDKINAPALFILRDFNRFLEDVAIARKLRNLSRSLKSKPQNIVILAPELTLPNGLTEVVHVVDFPLPSYYEIETEMGKLLKTTSSSDSAGVGTGDRHPWSAQCPGCGTDFGGETPKYSPDPNSGLYSRPGKHVRYWWTG